MLTIVVAHAQIAIGFKYPVTPCNNVSLRRGARCGKLSRRPDDHVISCASGGHMVQLQDAVVSQLAQAVDDSGATVRVEAHIPEFHLVATRRMDLFPLVYRG